MSREIGFVVLGAQYCDPKGGGSEPDHSEESDANSDTTDYDDSPN